MPQGSPEDPRNAADDEGLVVRPINRRTKARVAAAAAAGTTAAGSGRRPRKASRAWRILRAVGIAATVVSFLAAGVIGYAYQTTTVPRPEDVKISQYSTIYYYGGEEMARVGSENRTIVPLDRVPKHVQQAVLAAENRSFYTDPGFSPSGIARAAWTNLTEDATQGGSTITQQYVKKAYLTDEKTLTRKFTELIISVKLEQEYTKDEILGFYLNTIYFGRGAYGIEAASEVYFGKPVEQLTPEEGAVLASSIRSPAGYDPQNHPEAAKARWDYVLNGMVSANWMTQEQRDAAQYPQVLPIGPGSLNKATGPEGIIVQRVKDELETLGYSEDQINSEGLKVTTTIPKNYQEDAIQAVNDQLEGQPDNLVPGLVSVDPTTGAIRAYYGNSQGTGFDFAGRGYRQPGSSFKAFVLAAALEDGYALNTVRDGSSPQTFPDRSQPVRNAGGASCGSCTIKESITRSLNTTFYGLSYEMGPEKVADAAHRAGVAPTRADTGTPTLQEDNGGVASAIGIGLYEVTVKDMASAFATFAADGVYREPYMVQTITDAQGNVLYEHQTQDQRVFSHEVANDVSVGLSGVASYSNDALAKGRPTASKTGTVQLGDVNNKDAWMVGYTPQLSTAVWLGTETSEPLLTSSGSIIYGAGIPGKTWKQFMDSALADAEVMDMPTKQLIKGGKSNGNSAKATNAPPRTTQPTQEAPPTSEAPATSDAPAPTSDSGPTISEAPAPTTTNPPSAPAPTTTGAPPGNGGGNGGGDANPSGGAAPNGGGAPPTG